MATTKLKGIVKEVSPIETYGETNQGRRQTLVVFVPGYVDSYGQKRSNDEEWGIDIFNNKIDEFGLNSNCLSKKVDVEVYLSGRRWEKDEKSGYSISARLKSISLGEKVQISHEVPEDDGLPF